LAIDLTSALARLLSDASLRNDFVRDPTGVAHVLDVAESHRVTFCSMQAEQLEAQARVLVGKRFHAVGSLLPRTFARLGDRARDLFEAHAASFWPTGHRRHLEDAAAFGDFIAARNPGFADVAELNRLRFLSDNGRVRFHFVGVRVPGPRPRRAVQLLYRTSAQGIRSWLLHLQV
jgi:hypothetical protein